MILLQKTSFPAVRTGRRAFTILEILIVIAVLGMLVALAVTNVDKILGRSQEDIASMFVNDGVRTPLVSYRLDMGSYPSTEEGLEALIKPPANRADRWKGPYFEGGRLPRDPWGNPYQYRFPGKHNTESYDVWSLGPDGVDSEQNIGNW